MTQLQFNTALLALHDKLLYYALSLTTDKEKANDLLQDTCLKALTYREKFAANTNFKAWLCTIMKNTFINNYRRNKKIKPAFDSTNNDLQIKFENDKNGRSPESIYSSKEIVKCINALDMEYKIPFNMFLEGYKYKEIAENMNVPLGTIKSRIFFARKKLGNALKDYAF